MATLELPSHVTMTFDKNKDGTDNMQNFTCNFKPTEDSYWHKGSYDFKFEIPEEFPYKAPKVHCSPKVSINLKIKC